MLASMVFSLFLLCQYRSVSKENGQELEDRKSLLGSSKTRRPNQPLVGTRNSFPRGETAIVWSLPPPSIYCRAVSSLPNKLSRYRHAGDKERGRIAPTHSWPRYEMRESGQRPAPAGLYPRERTNGTHWIKGWLGLRAVWTQRLEGKIFPPAGIKSRSSSLQSDTILTELPRLP
jgi:hypothetical protein